MFWIIDVESVIKLGVCRPPGVTEDSELLAKDHDAAAVHPEAVPCARTGAVCVRQ